MSELDPSTTVLTALAGRLATDPDGPDLDFEGVGYSVREMGYRGGRLGLRACLVPAEK